MSAKVKDAQAQIAALTLMIEKLRRALYGRRSERKERLLGQLELELDELTARAAEDDLAAQTQSERTTEVKAFERRRPSRKPFPEHLPRERVVVPSPASCTCCGSKRLSKVGEDVTETLEVIPRRWKVIQTVREKFSCRDCEKLSQAPAPYPAVGQRHLARSHWCAAPSMPIATAVWCGARSGQGAPSAPAGSSPGRRIASIVLPHLDGPIIRRWWPPVAAISSARRAPIWPRTSRIEGALRSFRDGGAPSRGRSGSRCRVTERDAPDAPASSVRRSIRRRRRTAPSLRGRTPR